MNTLGGNGLKGTRSYDNRKAKFDTDINNTPRQDVNPQILKVGGVTPEGNFDRIQASNNSDIDPYAIDHK